MAPPNNNNRGPKDPSNGNNDDGPHVAGIGAVGKKEGAGGGGGGSSAEGSDTDHRRGGQPSGGPVGAIERVVENNGVERASWRELRSLVEKKATRLRRGSSIGS
jgi:hypothetical protein